MGLATCLILWLFLYVSMCLNEMHNSSMGRQPQHSQALVVELSSRARLLILEACFDKIDGEYTCHSHNASYTTIDYPRQKANEFMEKQQWVSVVIVIINTTWWCQMICFLFFPFFFFFLEKYIFLLKLFQHLENGSWPSKPVRKREKAQQKSFSYIYNTMSKTSPLS